MSDPQRALDPRKVLAAALDGLQETAARKDLPPPPTPAELAPSFPDYRIDGLIGQGGMGAVYRARHLRLDRDVAIKILPRHLAANPAFEARFRREARALAALDHPHVLRVHDFGQAGEWFYLVTEFVDGANLRQTMQLARVTPAEALRLVPQICDALQFAHGRGIVHRDIKPENILVDAAGNVKIADFGLAKMLGVTDQPGLTLTTQIVGTPHYMAPEQIERPTAVDHRADIFSLGVVFYEMLTGQLPLGRFGPPSSAGVPTHRIDPVVMKSLEREPAHRYQAAADLSDDLAAHASGRQGARPTLADLRKRRIARLVAAQQQPSSLLGALVLGVLLVLLPMFWQHHEWSLIGWTLLVTASVVGFRAMSLEGATTGRAAIVVHVVAAWFPVLLFVSLAIGVLLQGLLPAALVDDRFAFAYWIAMPAVDLAVVVWIAAKRLAARSRRRVRPRANSAVGNGVGTDDRATIDGR